MNYHGSRMNHAQPFPAPKDGMTMFAGDNDGTRETTRRNAGDNEHRELGVVDWVVAAWSIGGMDVAWWVGGVLAGWFVIQLTAARRMHP